MQQRPFEITIIPPDGREVPFERRRGDERLRSYGDRQSRSTSAVAWSLDRRRTRRSAYDRQRPKRIDLDI